MPQKKQPKFRPHQKLLAALAFALLLGLVSIEISDFLSTEGYVKADVVDVDGNTIILGQGCTAIIADTTEERAESILLGIEGKIGERPNTHDVFVDAFETFNITIDSITIDRFDGEYYYSNIVLRAEDKILKIDSRPSDAIAIALRANAPIYLNKTLLKENGKNIC
ncbi:MAG: bifunctional nuclease family protein [Candidatus Aenigmatarchaeota archaeon]